ncbi:unnamed protein product (macronuclear) [Paramecium tetraurelia]|uniref:RRM domain-containing protein n=1 Tax=Paramecium tetraurelia TaxID=5888 RepID=A0CQI1_PARTE|nr:uncharacterized protein GSPATT00009396001 [Paramecium tetraurelia]CAK73048.1 unnamed protein product [Paramecium tetraurelia]|eukprot:XP_001440445.1 hypothetical protein (macronuclear) [Paramecium tetraurelia strain d4-2]
MSSSSSSRSRSPKKNKKRVYVTGYSLKEDQHDIKKLFKKFGKIEEFAWKGKYCFIEFKDSEDAEKAVKKMNKEEVKGSVLQVEMARGNKPSKNNGLCYSCGRSGHLQVSLQHPFLYIQNTIYLYFTLKTVDIDHHLPVHLALVVSLEKNTRRNIKKRRAHPVRIPHQVVHQAERKRIRRRVQKGNQSPLQEALQKTHNIQSLLPAPLMTKKKKKKTLLKKRIKGIKEMVSNEVPVMLQINLVSNNILIINKYYQQLFQFINLLNQVEFISQNYFIIFQY